MDALISGDVQNIWPEWSISFYVTGDRKIYTELPEKCGSYK